MNQIEIVQNEFDQYQVVFWDENMVDFPIGQVWNKFEDAEKQVKKISLACEEFTGYLTRYDEEGE